MGFCVLHYDKQTGSSPGLSIHIERGRYRDGQWIEWHPENADSSKSHLNRELLPGELSRDERISKRIKDAGIKVKKNHVRALTLIMSASSEDMQRIADEGNLDAWCETSIKWAQETHGAENVVSAVLHMDETSPHLHLTVVPIVQGESKDQAYRKKKAEKEAAEGKEAKPKRKYKKKDENAMRLCAADVMTTSLLTSYQTSYAEAVKPYGLVRGIEGSKAKHVDINDWYKTLVPEVKKMKDEKAQLDDQIKDIRAEINEAQMDLQFVNSELERKRQSVDIINYLEDVIGTPLPEEPSMKASNDDWERYYKSLPEIKHPLSIDNISIMQDTIQADVCGQRMRKPLSYDHRSHFMRGIATKMQLAVSKFYKDIQKMLLNSYLGQKIQQFRGEKLEDSRYKSLNL